MPDQKVMVVGLDGATWDILRPMMDRGLMPNLLRLIGSGVSGPLRTTIPPITGSAWPSFQTGMNPGQHGIFSFEDLVPGTYGRRIINSHSIHGEPVWSILSRHGKRVCVINVPVTYPPRPVNGYLISCMLSPYGDRRITHPPELYEELIAAIGDYRTYVSTPITPLGGVRRFVDELTFATRKRGEAAAWLLKQKGSFDFFMVHFQCLDPLQHRALDYVDPRHPRYASRKPDDIAYVCEYYRLLDEMVGKVVEAADEHTTLIGLSDHGFGPVLKQVNINRFLQQQGLLRSRLASGASQSLAKHLLGLARKLDVFQVREWLVEERRNTILHRLVRERLRNSNKGAVIDWTGTKVFAWSAAGTFLGLHVNRRGREAQGIVGDEEYEAVRAQVSGLLMQLADPETGARVVERVYRREELYHGPHIDRMPDLVVQPVEGYQLSPWFNGDLVFEPVTRIIGDHRMNGIVFFNGAHVRGRGTKVDEANIMDIAPTVLFLLGVPVPSTMDGRVLSSVLDADWLEAHPIEIEQRPPGELQPAEAGERPTLSDAEEDVIRKRLAGLGYFES
jgi:predicted AlkP superfamily phosphohydrolase/phosphomutase